MSDNAQVALVTFNHLLGDFDGRIHRHIDLCTESFKKGAQLVCFPELSVSGYGLEDLFFSDHVLQDTIFAIDAICEGTKDLTDLIIVIGAAISFQNGLYNCSVVIQNGLVKGVVPKVALANDNVHYEARWFVPGKIEASFLGAYVGQQIFKIGNFRFGIAICEDLWVEGEGLSYLNGKVDLILNPSASHFAFDKFQVKRSLWCEISRRYSAVIGTCNILGLEAGELLYDGFLGFIDHLQIDGSDIFVTEFSNLIVRNVTSSRINVRKNYTKTKYLHIPELDLSPRQIYNVASPIRMHDETIPVFKEFILATTTGLYDYWKKSRQGGYVVSLSGGRDSSTVLILLYLMYKRYQINGEFGDFVQVVYQKSSASSPATLESAESLSSHLGLRLIVFPISEIVNSYQAFFDVDDRLSKQNLQARVRSTGAWLLANSTRSVLLTTGNRSELSVGYTTMDGDSSGGLNPIGGVSKVFINEFLQYLLENGYDGIDFSPISSILAVPPSAELEGDGTMVSQLDEEDLMPYSILQKIEELYVVRGYGGIDIKNALYLCESEYSKEQIDEYVNKFIRLFRISQWKRHRMAPSFHLDKYNLSYRSWYRHPILSV